MKKSQSGFAILELLVAIIAIASVTGVGYYIYQGQAAKTSSGSTSKSVTSSANKPNNEVATSTPEGYSIYESGELQLSFVYPSEWGRGSLNRNVGQTGAQDVVTFSAFSKSTIFNRPVVAFDTPDYKEKFAHDGYNVGSTDFQTTKAIIERQDPTEIGDADIASKGDNYIVYSGNDCVDSGYYISALRASPNSTYASVFAGYLSSNDKNNYCDPGAYTASANDKKLIEQLTVLIKSVRTYHD